MGLRDYFRPVSNWSVQRVREFMDDHNPEDYNLVDVRQPGEYEQKHLPGAKLIPAGELAGRLDELDPQKPTITY
jgi:rhodanese-related sulfurtransferase